MGVHAEAGTGVDLDDRAALLAHRARDVRGDEVDAGDIEPDHHRRLPRDFDVVGVNVVGAVDRGAAGAHVPGQFELNEASFLRNIVLGEMLAREDLDRLVVDRDASEDLFVPDAAAGILVGDVDQLADGVLAVTHDVRGHPFRDRDHLVVDDQDAVVLAGDEGFDHHLPAAALPFRDRESLAHGRFVGEIDHHAAAMIAVERLEHHRIAQAAGGVDGIVRGAHHHRPRHRNADLLQQAVGQFLVAGDIDGDIGGLAGDRRPDPFLVGAVPELDQRAAGIEPQHRNAPPLRLGHDGARGRAVGEALGDADDLVFQLGDEIEVRFGAVDEVIDQPYRELTGGDPDVLLGVGVDDVVETALARAAGLAAGDFGSGQVLQFEGDVLQDVAHPRPLAHPLQEAARLADGAGMLVQPWQQFGEMLVEAGNLVGRPVLEFADIDLEQDGGHPCPDVRAPENGGVANFERHGVHSDIVGGRARAARQNPDQNNSADIMGVASRFRRSRATAPGSMGNGWR
ncbi:MAG: hypothetical protein U0031_10955, partial [Thermomicrobiales bacterium]